MITLTDIHNAMTTADELTKMLENTTDSQVKKAIDDAMYFVTRRISEMTREYNHQVIDEQN